MRRIFYLILVVLMAMALPALAANGTASNQSLIQSGSQTVQATGAGGSGINQNIDQVAGQAVQGNSASDSSSNAAGIGNVTAGTAGSSGTVNQNLAQRADQTAAGSNLSTVNQRLSQNANQNISGLAANETMNQTLAQRANQAFQGSLLNRTGTNQTGLQNGTNQTGNNNQTGSWNESNYWRTNWTWSMPLNDQERSMINNRTNQFFTGYPATRGYIMPWNDLTRLAGDTSRNLDIIYIDEAAWDREDRISGANFIPLAAIYNRLSQLPRDRPIVIVGDSSMDAAIAMTILRMNGYNAWVAQRPTG